MSFSLDFTEPLPRETIPKLIEAVADYYSLFCKSFINIDVIRITTTKYGVGYFGDPAGKERVHGFFSNVLTEQSEIDQYSNRLCVKWVSEYDKGVKCVQLMRDAEKVHDEHMNY